MKNPLNSPLVAVVQAEVLINSRRVAPYALMVVFAANATLWWGWGPAVSLGWATNSDFYIVRNLQGFSFLLGLPIFNAVIMGDPVIRDFNTGIDPLIFSKPINRGQYLLGKFFGNFFVLVCCQSVFVLTLIVLQGFPTSQMVVQPVRVLPYFKHFFFFVVISHLVLAAIYFTVGTLTRNPKFVYGLAVCFYPVYITYAIFLLKPLPPHWAKFLDPMVLGSGLQGGAFDHSAEFLNRFVVSYSTSMIANRALMIVITVLCLTILYLRFSIVERTKTHDDFAVLDLSTPSEAIQYDPEAFKDLRGDDSDDWVKPGPQAIPLPEVKRSNRGVRANLRQLIAATGLELNLIRSEKSLIFLIPLTVLLAFLVLPFSSGTSEVSPSAGFAGETVRGLLLFFLGITVFYTGEALHRDRELRVEPILWSSPAPTNVFLMSKFLAILLLLMSLLLAAALTAMGTQLLRGQRPLEVSHYLLTYSVILVPSLAFMAAGCIALNVVLREKYLTYTLVIAISSTLFYLYSQGYNHWLYNPVLYGLWTESDLFNRPQNILLLRTYCVGLTVVFLLIAHLFSQRKSTRKRTGNLLLRRFT